MSLDLGTLVGKMQLDVSDWDMKLGGAGKALKSFGSEGEATAGKAGKSIGSALAKGADAELAKLPKNARGTVSQTSAEFRALSPAMRTAVLETEATAAEGLARIPLQARQAGQAAARELKTGLGDSTGARDAGADAADDYSGGFVDQAKTAGKVAGAAIGIGIAAGVVDNMNVEAGLNKLSAQLGLSAEETAVAGKLAGGLYRDNFGESLTGVNDAVRFVAQNIGLELGSADFSDVTAKVLTLADVFDQDLGMTTAAVGQMMKTGMAKDAAEALDIITKGMEGPANKADDLMETFNEYGTQFRKLGLDGATSVGLLNQALDGGARDADVAADAIGEFTKRTVGAIETMDSKGRPQLTALGQAFETLGLDGYAMQDKIAAGGPGATAALGTVLDKLRLVEDPVTKAGVAVELFGTQSEDMGAALDKMDVDTAADSLGKVGGAAADVVDKMGSGNQATIDTYKRKILGVGQDAIESVGPLAAVAGGVAAFGPAVLGVLGPIAMLVAARATQTAAATTAAAAETGAAAASSRGWIMSSLAAVMGAARHVGAWLLIRLQMIPTMLAYAAVFAFMAAGWISSGIAATAGAAAQVAAWLLTKIQAGISMAIQGAAFLVMAAGWLAAGLAATAGALVVAAAWLIALGPIGLLIAAVVGLVALIILNWDTIKEKTRAVWEWVKEKTRAIWDWIVEKIRTVVGGVVTFVREKWDAIKTKTRDVFDSISTKISGVMSAIRGFIRNAYDNTISPVFGKIKDGVDKVKDSFETAKDGIKTAWDKIKGILSTPVKWAVDNVINKLVGGVNKLIPGNGPLSTISTKGWEDGGYTGRIDPKTIAGVVHGDEQVINSPSRRRIEAKHPGLLDHMNATGTIPGYETGGRVVPGGGNRHTGYAWANYAGDFPNPEGTPVHAWKDGVVAKVQTLFGSYGKHMRFNNDDGTSWLVAHLSRFAAALGDKVKKGQTVAYTGNTGKSSGPHAHLEFMGGPYTSGGGSAGGGNPVMKAFDWIKDKFNFTEKMAGFTKGMSEHTGVYGGGLVDMAKNVGSKIWNGIKDQLGDVTGTAADIGKSVFKKLTPFDSGGMASGIGMMAKNTVEPERVLSPRETKVFNAAMARDFGAGYADSDTTRPPVQIDVHPAPGMDEEIIGRSVGSQLSFRFEQMGVS